MGGTDVGGRVDETEQPLIAAGIWVVRPGVEAELGCKEQVGAVDNGLVHLQIRRSR